MTDNRRIGVASKEYGRPFCPSPLGKIVQDRLDQAVRRWPIPFEEATLFEVVLRRFDNPDAVRTFERGKFESIRIGEMAIGRGTYEPGWIWSAHVGRLLGKERCDVADVGIVISGRATIAMDDGRVIEIQAGDILYNANGHDSWVVGQEPYVSLHLMGASHNGSIV
jgi:mannose-6-phosphate isomerase-like protein (cupin superfamily)